MNTMRLFFRLLFFSCTLVSVCFLSLITIYADGTIISNTDYEQISLNRLRVIANHLLDDIDQIVTDDYIFINGELTFIFPYFKNPLKAIDSGKSKYANEITQIQNQYRLDNLNQENVSAYIDAVYLYRTHENIDFSYNYDICQLESFLEILNNSNNNQYLLTLLTRISDKNYEVDEINDPDRFKEVLSYLPYYTTLYKKELYRVNKEKNIKGYSLYNFSTEINGSISLYSSLGSTQITNAIAYASKYAYNPNPAYYYYSGSDCTNFASQILEAAGITQADYYPDESKGWWHRAISSNGTITHKSSLSWRLSHTFALYMGVSNVREMTSNAQFQLFTQEMSTGDFILGDWESDGKWNHIGFVTYKSPTLAYYNNMYYYDFKVAQHTSNYHAWTSSSLNNWDVYSGRTYGFARK